MAEVAADSTTERALRKAAPVLQQRADVLAAYAFGSRVSGRPRAGSDLDIAVLLDPHLSVGEELAARLELADAVSRATGFEADIVPLGSASPRLAFQVLKYGQLLVEHDPRERHEFEVRALGAYYDARRYYAFSAAEVRRRIAEEGVGGGYRGHRDALAEARQRAARLAALAAAAAR